MNEVGIDLSTHTPKSVEMYLDEAWDAQSATGYVDDKAVASVSLTGSKTTILNMTLDGSLGTLVIRPDELPEEETTVPSTEETTEPTTQPTAGNDDYQVVRRVRERCSASRYRHKGYEPFG